MIPILCTPEIEQFSGGLQSNGIGALDECISCKVTETLNGSYDCTLKLPVNSRHYKDLNTYNWPNYVGKNGCTIYTTHDASGTPEPFDIVSISGIDSGIVTINAKHISNRLAYIFVEPTNYAKTVRQFIDTITNNTAVIECPFTFSSNLTSTKNIFFNKPRSILDALIGPENSVLTNVTCEFEFSNLSVKCNTSRTTHSGTNPTRFFAYGKNIVQTNTDRDVNDYINSILAFWCPESSPPSASFGDIRETSEAPYLYDQIAIADLLDVTEKYNSAPSKSVLNSEADLELNRLFNSPNLREIETLSIDIVPDSENKYSQDILLGDTVTIIHPYIDNLDIQASAKVKRVVYDSLSESYDVITAGGLPKTYGQFLKTHF